ncbi:MAG TPA: ATP-binding protein, partial [Allosphingosinicella sp.]|nr:ATP-binding protein [Allosphingosinicella sp.]
MAGEHMDVPEGRSPDWRRGSLASAGALLATSLLIALLMMVGSSNNARDQALASERHSYDVMLLTRTVDATVARAEAALGRYVLDEDQRTGSAYATEWQLAGQQIGELARLVRADPEQLARVAELRAAYAARGRELAVPAAAARLKQGTGAVTTFFQAGKSMRGPELRAKLGAIAAAERTDLRSRMAETRESSDQADRLAGWLGWLAVLVGLGAVGLGYAAFRAMGERLDALREAESEASRAQRLDEAVQERTAELLEANEALKAEAAEREAAESRLRQVQKMEAVGQLTGGIAHDFNNMLAVVVGGIDLARRKLTGSRREVEFHLDNAMEGATRAAALTRRLLTFARAEPLLPVGVTPTALIENMLELIDRSIGERIRVRTRFPEEPWNVRVDTNQLENAILNLAVNARDAMEGEGQLVISVDNERVGEGRIASLAAGDYVRISVSDTGAGIAPEHVERVFEPFFTTKPVGKGTGLGLSQIFGFAQESGGAVTLDSKLGTGTTVSLYLPRSAEAGMQSVSAPEESEAAVPVAGTEILVVEDDPRVSRATVGALEEIGYRPIPCASGKEALELLAREANIQLIITDVMMPEMTGPELVREATRLYPWIGTLFVTGYVGEAGEAEALSGHDLLRKPFTVSALGKAVSTALARR